MPTIHLMSARDLASELGISRSTAYKWLATGRGPKTLRLPNGDLRIRRTDFIEWLCKLETPQKGRS